jgi:hypothetical protein
VNLTGSEGCELTKNNLDFFAKTNIVHLISIKRFMTFKFDLRLKKAYNNYILWTNAIKLIITKIWILLPNHSNILLLLIWTRISWYFGQNASWAINLDRKRARPWINLWKVWWFRPCFEWNKIISEFMYDRWTSRDRFLRKKLL